MINSKNLAKKAYTEMAAMIRTMELRNQINEGEMLCLLGILDCMVVGEERELQKVLKEFIALPQTPETLEIDEIIKATLVSGELNNNDGLQQMVSLLSGLIEEKKRLLDQADT